MHENKCPMQIHTYLGLLLLGFFFFFVLKLLETFIYLTLTIVMFQVTILIKFRDTNYCNVSSAPCKYTHILYYFCWVFFFFIKTFRDIYLFDTNYCNVSSYYFNKIYITLARSVILIKQSCFYLLWWLSNKCMFNIYF